MLLFDGPAADHDDANALELLSACSSGLGGRFFDEIRTKRGLAYVVACSALPDRAGGSFLAALATSPEYFTPPSAMTGMPCSRQNCAQ